MVKLKKAILYIDGENLKHYIKDVLNTNSVSSPKLENIDYKALFSSVIQDLELIDKRFYSARLREYKSSLEKSKSLIIKQRILKTNLEKQGFTFIISGNVRGQSVQVDGKKKVIFKEKGVDVKIAVDLVTDACDRKVEVVVLCSSDSDLQPAVTEVKRRGIEIIYLGFEISPNKGLAYTCNRTILLRNSEIIDVYKMKWNIALV